MAFFQEWIEQYKTYNKNIKLSLLANVFPVIGLGIFMVVYNFYIREIGYSQNVNGEIIALNSLGMAIFLIPAGIMSDRFGRKRVILYGIVASSFILLLRSIVESEVSLLTTSFFAGIFTAILQVSMIPWLTENSAPKQRIHLFSLHSAIMTGSSVIGIFFGGVLTDFLSLFLDELISIRITLIMASVFYLIGLFPFLKTKTVTKQKPAMKGKLNLQQFMTENKKSFIIICLFAISQLLIGIGAGLVIPYLNLYFADRFGASNSIIGLIISLGQIATAIAMFIGPLVVLKVGEVKAVVYLQLLSLPFLLLTAFSTNIWLASIGFLFRQALMNAGNPIQSSLIMAEVHNSVRGLANSINQTVFNLGWALMGPVSTAIVVQYGPYWGYAHVFSITAGLYLVGSIYFYFVISKMMKNRPNKISAHF